jgi:DNA-binding PadR family transcriptional regulator
MGRNIPNLLPQVSLGILLALSLKPRHGYELIQQIEHDSAGKVKLGPGALYGAIKHLSEDSLIEEVPLEDSERRRYYRLTKQGWNRLGTEMKYYDTVVKLAQKRHALGGDSGAFGWNA